jgi:hypothetical protein
MTVPAWSGCWPTLNMVHLKSRRAAQSSARCDMAAGAPCNSWDDMQQAGMQQHQAAQYSSTNPSVDASLIVTS